MKSYTLYKTSTGEIRGFLQADVAPSSDWFEPGVVAIESVGEFGDNGESYYLPAGTLTARPATVCTLTKTTITADGTDSTVLSGIPTGSVVRITRPDARSEQVVDDGSLEITSDAPCRIRITVTPEFPAKPVTVTVTAV